MTGDIIKQLRDEKGYSQTSLGDILQLSPSAIGMYEQNRRTPDADTLIKMHKLFNVSCDYLLTITEVRDCYPPSSGEETFQNRFARLLKEINFTLLEISSKTKIRRSRLEDISKDKTPNMNELICLSSFFQESSDYLLCLTDERTPLNKRCFEPDSFSARLSYFLSDEGYSELELSELLGITISRLRRLESGEDEPDLTMLRILSNHFKVSTDFLLGLQGQSRKELSNHDYPFVLSDICIHRIQKVLKTDRDNAYLDILGIAEDECYLLYHYGFVPHVSVLIGLCKIGGVSADYLLGIENTRAISNEDESETMILYNQLTNDGKEIIKGKLKEILLLERCSESSKNNLKLAK